MGNISPNFLHGLVLTLFLVGVIVEHLPHGKKYLVEMVLKP